MSTTEVSTATGSIDVDRLGRTLMHEHIFCTSSEVLATGLDDYWDEDRHVATAVAKLNELKEAGIDTLVDCTVPGLGRMIGAVQRVAQQINLNIVVATGLYSTAALPLYFSIRGPGTLLAGDDPLDALFRREIEHGIADTGIRPAFIKCALETTDPDSQLARPLAAAARVSAELGTPIQVHTDVNEQTGTTAIDILQRYSVDLSRVVIGHSGDSNDVDYLKRILDAGAIVGCDRFGIDFFNSTEHRLATLTELIAGGYASQVVLSHDTHAFNDVTSDEASEKALRDVIPDHHYRFIPQSVLPALRERGVSERDIDAMLVGNPARFFSAS